MSGMPHLLAGRTFSCWRACVACACLRMCICPPAVVSHACRFILCCESTLHSLGQRLCYLMPHPYVPPSSSGSSSSSKHAAGTGGGGANGVGAFDMPELPTCWAPGALVRMEPVPYCNIITLLQRRWLRNNDTARHNKLQHERAANIQVYAYC